MSQDNQTPPATKIEETKDKKEEKSVVDVVTEDMLDDVNGGMAGGWLKGGGEWGKN